MNIIWSEKIKLIQILLGLKNHLNTNIKKIHPNTNTNIIRLKKSPKYKYEYYSVWKYRPNMNTNIIQLEKITRIRIQKLVFGLNYSNNIWIPNYSLTSALVTLCTPINSLTSTPTTSPPPPPHMWHLTTTEATSLPIPITTLDKLISFKRSFSSLPLL